MLLFIRSNWGVLLTSLVGLSAIVVYCLQRQHILRSAATKIIMQIDQIESIIVSVRKDLPLTNVKVYNLPIILDNNYWEQYGYLLYRKMSFSDIQLVDNFYLDISGIEKSRASICHIMHNAWVHKDEIKQSLILKSIECPSDSINDIISKYEANASIFTPAAPVEIISREIGTIRLLQGTTAYESIRKLSYSR